ncbi:type II toxin-antitoxin system death-on-curing family toxin [Methylobacterium nonmethylotrophicum]|uniref:Type II toxin-antitoxin system death-on-curing family toxin n=1 Tax=Methylobacterium nonmethylotrophicum TaxID=1141884 RepID=A0A4Z0NRB0_9HYPH|nr:type II toxin-antitoxin system death-on-curing family toxin [Methylobacterium nonmethylotrophicum]TGD99389.1 type II toxin-antitoxin system death-on-curing family toxin [Methylobacterium nonmethylotrophicum]
MTPLWVEKEVVLAIHDEQLAEHGGAVSMRDRLMLDSALDRPRNRHEFGGCTDICELAACYAFGLARNHGFLDGNKRVSAVVTELLLALNGYELTASDGDVVQTWTAIAAGEMTEKDITAWIRRFVSASP